MSGFMKNVQWFSFRNDSGEEIPPHAFIRADNGSKDAEGKIWISAKKPNASGAGITIYVNGPLAVANGKFGLCTNSKIVAIAYDDTDAPVAGDSVGPKSGEWLGWKDEPGFKVLSLNDSGQEMPLAWVVRKGEDDCPTQNAKFGVTLIGPPGGGTWSFNSWDVDGSVDSISGLAFDITAASLETALEGHSGIGSGNVSVSGGPADEANFLVELNGALAGLFVENPIIGFSSLTGTGVGGLAWPVQIGRP